MGKRQSKPPFKVDESAPFWFVTFADMITQIMAFFILMFSMSVVQETKFKAAMGSLQAWLGLLPGQPSVMQQQAGDLARARMAALENYREGTPGEHIEVMTVDEGKKIAVGGKALFAEGSARLLPGSNTYLWQVADLIRGLQNRVEVRGHSAPGEAAVSGVYKDEWELGWARAEAVADFLVDECKIPANRLRVSSGGSVDPAARNLFHEETSRNRRVEVVVTGEFIR